MNDETMNEQHLLPTYSPSYLISWRRQRHFHLPDRQVAARHRVFSLLDRGCPQLIKYWNPELGREIDREVDS